MTDDELEQMFRMGLGRRAHDDGATPGDHDWLGAARRGARRHRRIQVAVGVAVVALVATPAAVLASTRGPGTEAVAPTTNPRHPADWRVESYGGVDLWVPPTWGWGSVSMTRHGLVGTCGRLSFESAGGRTSADPHGRPYVARPDPAVNHCATRLAGQPAHVWFDSPLTVGSDGDQVTVRVAGVVPFNVTVADSNSVERRRILNSISSALTDANGCPTQVNAALSDPGRVDARRVTSLSVCLYFARQGSTESGRPLDDPVDRLYYSTRVTARAQAAVTAIERIKRRPPANDDGELCTAARGLATVWLVAHTTSPDGVDEAHIFVVSADVCPGGLPAYYAPGTDTWRVVNAASIRLWAVAGVPLYIRGGPADFNLP